MFTHEARAILNGRNIGSRKSRGEVALALVDAAIVMGHEPETAWGVVRTDVRRVLDDEQFRVFDEDFYDNEQEACESLMDALATECQLAWAFLNATVGPFFADSVYRV